MKKDIFLLHYTDHKPPPFVAVFINIWNLRFFFYIKTARSLNSTEHKLKNQGWKAKYAYIEYLLYQEYLKWTHCNTLLQPKHESIGALIESASVSILLHAQAA